jgi:hypothetical protein
MSHWSAFQGKLASMRFSCRLGSFFLLAGQSLFGCASQGDGESSPWTPPPVAPAPETRLIFEQSGTLGLGLREERTLSVRAEPPAPYELSFALIGDSLDATLDKTTQVTDGEGRASIRLRAPNKSTTFRLLVWIHDGPSAEVPVAVSGEGFSELDIVPMYKGNRAITEWTAMVVARSTCKSVSPLLPEGGPLALSASALEGEPLVVTNAPVGPSLAVAVRAGHYAWGCTDASHLIAGERMTVKVNILDKPLDVAGTNLDVTLAFTPDQTPFLAMLGSATTTVLETFLPKGDAAGSALLDAMAARIPETDAPLFAEARVAGAWDTLAVDHLAAQPVSLHGALEGWLLAAFDNQPAELEGRLTAVPNVPTYATFSAIRLGNVPADEAGIPSSHLVKLTADPGDTVHLGGSLFWLPTRYIGGLCKTSALEGAPEGATMVDALSGVAGCAALGDALGSFGACDATCIAGLCEEALAERWDNALDGSALQGKIGIIDITAAGMATVDDVAVPATFQGSWLGSVTDGEIVAKIEKAEMTAEPPPPPDPP